MENIVAFNSKNSYRIEISNNNLNLMKEKNQKFFDVSLPGADTTILFTENVLYKLEDDEWFYIDYIYSEKISQILENFNRYLELEALNKEYMKKVKFFIYSYEDNDLKIINIQRVYSSAILKTNSFLTFGNNSIEYKFNDDVVEIKNDRDIIIDIVNKRVYFRKFEILTSFDDKFIEYYREATDSEINSFKSSLSETIPIFCIKGEFKIGSRNSKKIKFISDNDILNKFENKQKELKKYIKQFSTILNDFGVNGNFRELIITNDNQLRHVVNILQECYSITTITKRPVVTNSYRELK